MPELPIETPTQRRAKRLGRLLMPPANAGASGDRGLKAKVTPSPLLARPIPTTQPIPDRGVVTPQQEQALARQARLADPSSAYYGQRLQSQGGNIPDVPRTIGTGAAAMNLLAGNQAITEELASIVGQLNPAQRRRAAELQRAGASRANAIVQAYRETDLPSAKFKVGPLRPQVGVKGALELVTDPTNLLPGGLIGDAAKPLTRAAVSAGGRAAKAMPQVGEALRNAAVAPVTGALPTGARGHLGAPKAGVRVAGIPKVAGAAEAKQPWEMTYQELRRVITPEDKTEVAQAAPALRSLFPEFTNLAPATGKQPLQVEVPRGPATAGAQGVPAVQPTAGAVPPPRGRPSVAAAGPVSPAPQPPAQPGPTVPVHPSQLTPQGAAQTAGYRAGRSQKPLPAPPLPPLYDNYRKPLATYTDALYHETSPELASRWFFTNTGQNNYYFANTANLARGQGGHGVMLELDPAGIMGQVNTSKPAWTLVWRAGEAEFLVRDAMLREFTQNIRSVTLSKDLRMSNVDRQVLKRAVAGWPETINPDGSITYVRPAPRRATPSAAQPPAQTSAVAAPPPSQLTPPGAAAGTAPPATGGALPPPVASTFSGARRVNIGRAGGTPTARPKPTAPSAAPAQPPARVPVWQRGNAGVPPSSQPPTPPRASGAQGLPPPPTGTVPPSGRVPGGPKAPGPTPPQPPDYDYGVLRRSLEPDRDPLVQRAMDEIPVQLYDANYPLVSLSKVTGVPAKDLAQVVPGSVGWGQEIVRRYFKPVLKSVGKDLRLLEEYMVLQAEKDILANNPAAKLPGAMAGRGGIDRAERTLRARLGTARFQRIEQAAAELARLNDEQVLRPLLENGIISRDLYTNLKRTHPHYIPLNRADFDDLLAYGTRPVASVTSTGIKRMLEGGSTRLLSNPLGRLLSQPITVQTRIARNRAAKSIVEALRVRGEQTGVDLIRFVDGPAEKMKALELAAQRKGKDVSRPAEHSKLMDTISFYQDGEKWTAEIPAEFARVAKSLGVQPDNIFLAVLRQPGNILRAGATQYNPFFLPVNMVRDAAEAFFREGMVPFSPDYLRGWQAVITKNSLYQDAARSGVFMSGIVDDMTRAKVAKGRIGGLEVRNPMDALLLPFTFTSEANTAMERSTRIAAFTKFRRQGLSELESAVRARDVTVDFSRSGHSLRVINQVIPFTNVSVQGSINLVRTVGRHPVRSAAIATLFAGPTVLSRVNNMRYDTSKDIPDYEYTRNWVIQYGEGTRKDGTRFPLYAKVPKSEFAAVATFPVEALFSLARKTEDRSGAELVFDYGMDTARNISPVDPNIVSMFPMADLPMGLATGVDSFTKAPIVPQREQKLPPEDQFGAETSEAAVALGRATGISPRKLDFAMRQALPGTFQQVRWLLDMGLEAIGYHPQPFGAATQAQPTTTETVSRVPGVSRFVGTRATQTERRGREVLADVYRAGQRDFLAIPGMKDLGVALGAAGNSIDLDPGNAGGSVDLTPQQEADYQTVINEIVVPQMRAYAATLTDDLSNEEKRLRLMRVMGVLRDEATKKYRADHLDELRAQLPVAAPAAGRVTPAPTPTPSRSGGSLAPSLGGTMQGRKLRMRVVR